MIAALLVLGLCPADNLQDRKGDGDMSDESKGVRGQAAKPKTSEGWGDPPLWSPWNFQFPSPNREGQKDVYRNAHASAQRDEAK
jgi:hypothetical protein